MALNQTPGVLWKIGKCTDNDLKPVLQLFYVSGEICSLYNKKWNVVGLYDGSGNQFAYIPEEIFISKELQQGAIIQLIKFELYNTIEENTSISYSYILVGDLDVVLSKCLNLGDPKPFPGNKTPSVKKLIPPKSEEDHVDPDVNDDRHRSRKRQYQSSDGEIGACFEKLEKLGWGEGPMYDAAVFLFGESSDYRKIWLHLKPNSCANWVKNAGGKYGLLG